VVFFTIMAIWRIGRVVLREYTTARSQPVDAFLATLDDRVAARVPGTAVFMTSLSTGVPLILDHHIRRIRVLHKHVVLLTIVVDHVPYVALENRLEIEQLPKGFTRVIAHYGFMDEPDVPAMLGDAFTRFALPGKLDDATYYLGRETFLVTAKGQLGPIREGVFAFLSKNAASATSYFGIPSESVVELGTQIDL
jgi:KUP system potassium uptake protein